MNFQNNNLLNHAYANNQQMAMMNNLRRAQQSKWAEKINNIERNKMNLKIDNNELKNIIIRPIKIEKVDKRELMAKYSEAEKSVNKPELENLWKKRNNAPYKNIIKDEKYIKKDFKTKDDLIVHRVSRLDKLGVDKEVQKFESNIEKHNNELKIQYSQNNQTEHKKKFEYNNVYKYNNKYNPKDHESLKDDNIDYLKKEQQKLESDKKKIDDVIESLVVSNILTEEEKLEIDFTELNPSDSPKESPKDDKINTVIDKDVRDKYMQRKKSNK